MKSTVATPPTTKLKYTVELFKWLSDNGFTYYTSASEFLVVNFKGVWTNYKNLRKDFPDMPEAKEG